MTPCRADPTDPDCQPGQADRTGQADPADRMPLDCLPTPAGPTDPGCQPDRSD
jgi:hypothetical protein